MSRPAWMDKAHEFRENINDGSMCLCGVPALYHERWELEQQMRDVFSGVLSRENPAALIRGAVTAMEEWVAGRACPNPDQWKPVMQELLLLASEYGT